MIIIFPCWQEETRDENEEEGEKNWCFITKATLSQFKSIKAKVWYWRLRSYQVDHFFWMEYCCMRRIWLKLCEILSEWMVFYSVSILIFYICYKAHWLASIHIVCKWQMNKRRTKRAQMYVHTLCNAWKLSIDIVSVYSRGWIELMLMQFHFQSHSFAFFRMLFKVREFISCWAISNWIIFRCRTREEKTEQFIYCCLFAVVSEAFYFIESMHLSIFFHVCLFVCSFVFAWLAGWSIRWSNYHFIVAAHCCQNQW